jgi:hypothetical protein
MRAYAFVIVLMVASTFILLYESGCVVPKTPAQAEAAYTAEQLRCVDVATTLAESKACRKQVDEKWGVKR